MVLHPVYILMSVIMPMKICHVSVLDTLSIQNVFHVASQVARPHTLLSLRTLQGHQVRATLNAKYSHGSNYCGNIAVDFWENTIFCL